MNYCLYNAIKTPDGTVLWCQNSHDYQIHEDKVSGESYMNDGFGHSIRRSINDVPFEDLSVWAHEPFEKVRTAPFWGSYGKDGKSARVMLSLQEMEDEHIQAVLRTQRQLKGTVVEKLFLQEIDYRLIELKENLDEKLDDKKGKKTKKKL
jgi:hypothetical protein